MALTNPIIFGLEVTRNLADVKDNNIALQSLTLDIKDLDVIRGSFSEGASESDWLSFSGLSVPIYKQIRRFYQDEVVLDGEDPERNYELLIECVRQDLEGVEV